jgi:CheY-like chemotaxis protein
MPSIRQPSETEESSSGTRTSPGGLARVVHLPATAPHVLVVADRPTSRALLSRVFQSAGMRAAHVGSDALLDELRRVASAGRPFPIVVLDARAGRVDGFALAARIRARPEVSAARIVLLLTSGSRGDAARCRELDVSAYLTKPLCAPDVLAAIRTVVELARQGPSAPLVTRHLIAGRPEPLQVLLAEDDPSLRFLVTRVLEKRGHSVVATGNGHEALAALDGGRFDVLLTDVEMPGLDGRALVKAVREREANGARRLPVVALTGHGPGANRARLLDGGVDVCLGKPFIPEDVFFTLEAVTGASASREARALSASKAFDRDALLTEVGGDMDLLGEMVKLFREDWPRRVAQLRAAVRGGRGHDLAASAHALKGSIGTFRAADAFETARRLEFLGRQEDFAAADQTVRSLEEKLRALESSLSTLLEEERK